MSHDHHSRIRLLRRRWDEEDARRDELEAQAILDCHLLPKTKTGSQAIDREAMSRAGLFGKSPSAFAFLDPNATPGSTIYSGGFLGILGGLRPGTTLQTMLTVLTQTPPPFASESTMAGSHPWSPCAFQMRCTLVWLMPISSAIMRTLQCVALAGVP
jgi:hypothetical protein